MEPKRDYDFTFGNEVEADCWDLDQDLLDEGWTANKVHQIQKIEQNMNDIVVSKRTTIKQVVDKEKEINTEHYKFNDCKQIKKRKETISTAYSFKKTRKEEIRELLLWCATKIQNN